MNLSLKYCAHNGTKAFWGGGEGAQKQFFTQSEGGGFGVESPMPEKF